MILGFETAGRRQPVLYLHRSVGDQTRGSQLPRGCRWPYCVGQVLPRAGCRPTREVILSLRDADTVTLDNEFLQHFFMCIGFQTISNERCRRIVEASLLETRSDNEGSAPRSGRVGNSTACRVEVAMISSDEVVAVSLNAGTSVSALRTSMSDVPPQHYAYVTKVTCFIAPGASARLVAKGATFNSGYINVRFVDNATENDTIILPTTASSGALNLQDGGTLHFNGVKCAHIRFDAQRHDVHVDLLNGNIEAVGELLRAFAFRTSSHVSFTIMKSVLFEVYIPEVGVKRTGTAPHGPPSPAKDATTQSSSTVRRYMQGVYVCPPSIFTVPEKSITRLPHSPTLQFIHAFTCPTCAADEAIFFYDGGVLTVEIVSGATPFDFICLKEDVERGIALEPSQEGMQFLLHGTHVATFPTPIRGTPLKVKFTGLPCRKPNMFWFGHHDVGSASRSISRDIVRSVLDSVAYSNYDRACYGQKVLRATLVDSHGMTSEAVCELEIYQPNAMTKIFVGKSTTYRYRHGDPKLRSPGDVLQLFPEVRLVDDDTEYVKNGYIVLEPFLDTCLDDKFLILNSDVISVQGSMVLHKDSKIGTFRNDASSRLESGGLTLSLFPGVSLETCANVLAHLAYVHTTPHPRKAGVRAFFLRFNAGDGAEDTRIKIEVDVQPPILWVFPMYHVLNYSQGCGKLSVQHNVYVGLPYGTPLAGCTLTACISHGMCDEDILDFVMPRSLRLEGDKVVVDVAVARELLGGRIVTPTAGYTGVVVGALANTRDGKGITLSVDRMSIVTSEFLQLLVPMICYENTSASPHTHRRNIVLSLSVSTLNESVEITTEVEVQSVDNMTEVVLAQDHVTCVQGFPVRIALGARVTDPDTTLFEAPHSYVTAEMVNCAAVCRDEISSCETSCIRFDEDTYQVRYCNKEQDVPSMVIGTLDPAATSGKACSVLLSDCPIQCISEILSTFTYFCHEPIKQKMTRMIEINVCGGPNVAPTRARVQVNVHPRALVGIPTGYRIHADYGTRVRVLPQQAALLSSCLSGGEVVFRLLPLGEVPPNAARTARAPQRCDRLTMETSEFFQISKNVVTLTQGGTRVCCLTISQEGHRLTLSCPRGSKYATGPPLTTILQCVMFEANKDVVFTQQQDAPPSGGGGNLHSSLRRSIGAASSNNTSFRRVPGLGIHANPTSGLSPGVATCGGLTPNSTRKSINFQLPKSSPLQQSEQAMHTPRRLERGDSIGAGGAGSVVCSITVVVPGAGELISSTDFVYIQ